MKLSNHFALILIPICISFFALKNKSIKPVTNLGNFNISKGNQAENNITFILGEDKDLDNPYYQQAEKYYRNHPTEKTEEVITHCRSISAMRNYLNENPPVNQAPWNKINIVVHSNQWNGIGVPVSDDGTRTTTAILQSAIDNGEICPLPKNIINKNTSFNFHACGLGQNQAMLNQLAFAFSGDKKQKANVRSSRYFVFYNAEKNNSDKVEKYLSHFWYAFYKTGYRPGDLKLSKELSRLNPTASEDWQDALSRKKPRFPGDLYHYTFNIPVSWTMTYENKTDRPSIDNQTDQENWLNEQTDLMEALKQYGIPMEKFRWQFKETMYEFEDGSIEPAIVANGKVSILCVLKAMVDEDNGSGSYPPFQPDLNDGAYYGISN